MKYIKFGFGAIAAQAINAKCCCGNSNNNNNNNGGENNKSEEDIFVDEIEKYFKVTKDKVIFKKKITAKDANYYTQEFLTPDEKKTVKKEYKKAVKKDTELRQYELTKMNFKSKNGLCVLLISKKIELDKTELNIYDGAKLEKDYNDSKDINVYTIYNSTDGIKAFIKEEK